MIATEERDDASDRAIGSIVGLAVGDALGTTLEFEPRNDGQLHTEMVGGGWLRLEPGQRTDDTAMALALAESLADREGFDPADVMARFVDWYKRGTYSCTGAASILVASLASLSTSSRESGSYFRG